MHLIEYYIYIYSNGGELKVEESSLKPFPGTSVLSPSAGAMR